MSDETQTIESNEAGWGIILILMIGLGFVITSIPSWLEGWTIIGRITILLLTAFMVVRIFFCGNISGLTKAIYCLLAIGMFNAGWSGYSSDDIFKKAVLAGNIEVVKEAITDDKAILKTAFGKNAIQEAATSGYADIVKLLIDNDVDAERAIDGGKGYENAIYLALANNHPDVVKTIKDSGKYNVEQWVDLYNKHLEQQSQVEEQALAESVKQERENQLLTASSMAKDAAITVVKNNLSSPSSFKLIYHKLMWAGQDLKGRAAFVSKLDFEAANGYGSSIKNCYYTTFAIGADEQVYTQRGLAVHSCADGVYIPESEYIDLLVENSFKR